MRLKPIFTYCLRDMIRAALVFVGVIILVVLLSVLLSHSNNGSVYFNGGFEIAAGITMFVIGICSIRDYLRLGIQNGIGRNTTMLAMLIALICTSVMLAVIGEVVCSVGAELTKNNDHFNINTLFSMIYAGQNDMMHLGDQYVGFTGHIHSVIVVFVTLMGLYLSGCFFSVLFYRLNRVFKVVVAIALPFIFIWFIPVALLRVVGAVGLEIALKIVSTPALLSLCLLAGAAVIAVVDWLLVFRAPIKAVK